MSPGGLLGRQFIYLAIRVVGSMGLHKGHPARCWQEKIEVPVAIFAQMRIHTCG